jgi:hypothetical protein
MMRRLWVLLRRPVTLCAWCQPKRTVLRYGNPFVPTSHGMCKPCAEAWLAESRSALVFHAVKRGERR